MKHVQLSRDWIIDSREGVQVIGREIRLGDTLHCGQLGQPVGDVYEFSHPSVSDIRVRVAKDVVETDDAFVKVNDGG